MENGLNVTLYGENSGRSKLTNKQVIDIYISKEPYKNLIEKYNVSKSTISSIRCGRNWNHLTKEIK